MLVNVLYAVLEDTRMVIGSLIVVLSLLGASSTSSFGEAKAGEDSQCRTIVEGLESYHSLKPGITRHDVEQYFELDGGANFRTEDTYVYKKCHYIKVKLSFKLDPQVKDKWASTDTVLEVSQLYIAYPSKD